MYESKHKNLACKYFLCLFEDITDMRMEHDNAESVYRSLVVGIRLMA